MDLQQLRSWIFELYDSLENDRQYILFDASRGNLLVDVPPFSERALRLIRGTGRSAVLLVTGEKSAAHAQQYREALGVQVAAHEADAAKVRGGADVVLKDGDLLNPDARVYRVGDATVLIARRAGGVLFCGALDLASPASRALLAHDFSVVLSASRPPIWNAGKEELMRLHSEMHKPRRRFGLLLQTPWDRQYRGRLQDQMKANALIPTDATASHEAAMGQTTLVASRAARDLIERPARPQWSAASAAPSAQPAAKASARPRNFEEDWQARATARPSTTIANAARDIQPAPGLHRPRPLGARFRELPLELLGGTPSVDWVGGIDLSRDGREVAFSWNLGGSFQIHVAPLAGEHVFQLTGGHERATWPRWSPDARWIAFLRDTGGDEVFDLWIVDRDGKNERKITAGVTAPAWAPDGSRLTVVARESLAIVDVASGHLTPVLGGGLDGEPADWSPDGAWIAASHRDASGRLSIALVPGAGGNPVPLDTRLPGDAIRPRWSPDGRAIAFTARAGERSRLAVARVEGGKVTAVDAISSTPFDEGDAVWRPDLRGIVYPHREDPHTRIDRMFLASRAATPIADAPGAHGGQRVAPDSETVVYLHSGATSPSDVWMRPARVVQQHRVTSSLPPEIDPAVLVTPASVRYPTAAGDAPGLLYVPHAEAVKKVGKAPAVVHLGSGFSATFDPFAQIMANRGYVVLVPRGTDADEIVAAAAWLEREGIADGQAIGVHGSGLAASAVVRDPRRFGAAVWLGAVVSAADAGALSTPVLALLGANDAAVPKADVEAFKATAAKGTTRVECQLYADEGRGFHLTENRVDALKLAAEWFDRHLLK